MSEDASDGVATADQSPWLLLRSKQNGKHTMSEADDATLRVADGRRGGWLNSTVTGAGLTSALGDFCYETTTVILPGFLAVLGVPAAALGIIEGVADAVASFTKMVAGLSPTSSGTASSWSSSATA
jgi:hypothetical protein